MIKLTKILSKVIEAAFAVIAASLLHLEISCVLEQVVSELSALLKKANQPLRQATHGTLSTLFVGYGDKIGLAAYKVIIVELSSLISPRAGTSGL
ncbi:Cullin-associated NEDD8-dissociated protein 1 [Orobanche hederae]